MPSLESGDHHFWSRARQFELAEQIANANAIHKLVRDSEFYFLSAIYSPFSLKMYSGSLPLETYNLYRALEFHIMQTILESFSILRENCDGYDAHLLLQLEAQLIGEAKLTLETELIAKLNEEDLPEAVSIFTEELLMQAELSVVGSSDDQTIAYTIATVAAWLRLYHVIGQHFMNWIRGKIEGNHLYQDWFDRGLLVELEPNYQNLVKSLTPIVSVVRFDNVKVGEVFDSLSQLREILYRNVEESQKLVGIDRRRMHKTSRENVSVSPDFISLINKLHNKEDFNGFVHVYSLDFSSDFISNIFETEMSRGLLHCSANQIFWHNEEGISTGQVSRVLKYPGHLALLPTILLPECITICVGCVVDDLPCLLKADMGIVVEPAESLIALGNNFGVKFLPLLDMLMMKQKDCDIGEVVGWKHQGSGLLFVGRNWCDVAAFICTLHDVQ
ncbi:bifunctional TH2 protein, mitochondrial [Prunus persica]|nr:bifunctional TH2 protein, mitochondrial [Prunus persica]